VSKATPPVGATEGAKAAPADDAARATDDAWPSTEGWVEAAVTAYLYRNLATAIVSNLALATFALVALYPEVEGPSLIAWYVALVVINAARVVLGVRYRRTRRPDPDRWRRRYAAGLVVNGLVWGIAVPLYAISLEPLHQMVLVVMIAGVTAGALPMTAVALPAYIVFLMVNTGPVAVTYLGHAIWGGGSRAHIVLGFITIAYIGALGMAARAHNTDQRSAYALSARLREANRTLEYRASHDAPTGLWNRDRFELALDQECDRTARYGGRFSLVMIDIDRFKRVNDDHGHDTGDIVLQHLARLIRQALRASDQAGRWGGEEFMVLLPETGADDARELAERLRRRVGAEAFAGPGHLTISLGVTSTDGHEDRTEVLKRLDTALYRAKKQGRNRVEVVAQPVAGTDIRPS
jgi:diguanylate cyclase (GGDEF)-like protein